MDIFVVACFAIPILHTTVTIGRSIFEADRDYAMAKANEGTWKRKDGKRINIVDMSDSHLANALRMVGRTWQDKVKLNTNFKSLSAEARKRGFQISFLDPPIQMNGREEYIEVFIPTPRSKLSPMILPTDWDSRPQE